MEYKCPSCKNPKYITETIKIEHTKEVVTVKKCTNCGTVTDAEIERPEGMLLKWKRGAGEIRFSENEKRNFASYVLSMMETQIKLLEIMAAEIDQEKTDEIIKDRKETRLFYEYHIRADDDCKPAGMDIDDYRNPFLGS